MAEVVIPEIKHEYIRQVDTETTKNDWFDECIADNKEAAWAGIGTSENDSQYQPAPSVEPDYYMQYCSSDDYDYLKDYRLIWGYGIGIIEQDVICSLSTGEHLAEGKDACDTYAAENAAGQDTDWKRGTWIKFSGNRNVSPTRIGEVVLPDRVISLKDLCAALTLKNPCDFYLPQENGILNAQNLCGTKTNSPITLCLSEDATVPFTNALNLSYAFAYTDARIWQYNTYAIDESYMFYHAKVGHLLEASMDSSCNYASKFEEATGDGTTMITASCLDKAMFKNSNNLIVDTTITSICKQDVSECFYGCDIYMDITGIDFSEARNVQNMFYDINVVEDEINLDLSSFVEHDDDIEDRFNNFFHCEKAITNFNITSPNCKIKGDDVFYSKADNINIINVLKYYEIWDKHNFYDSEYVINANKHSLFYIKSNTFLKGTISGVGLLKNPQEYNNIDIKLTTDYTDYTLDKFIEAIHYYRDNNTIIPSIFNFDIDTNNHFEGKLEFINYLTPNNIFRRGRTKFDYDDSYNLTYNIIAGDNLILFATYGLNFNITVNDDTSIFIFDVPYYITNSNMYNGYNSKITINNIGEQIKEINYYRTNNKITNINYFVLDCPNCNLNIISLNDKKTYCEDTDDSIDFYIINCNNIVLNEYCISSRYNIRGAFYLQENTLRIKNCNLIIANWIGNDRITNGNFDTGSLHIEYHGDKPLNIKSNCTIPLDDYLGYSKNVNIIPVGYIYSNNSNIFGDKKDIKYPNLAHSKSNFKSSIWGEFINYDSNDYLNTIVNDSGENLSIIFNENNNIITTDIEDKLLDYSELNLYNYLFINNEFEDYTIKISKFNTAGLYINHNGYFNFTSPNITIGKLKELVLYNIHDSQNIDINKLDGTFTITYLYNAFNGDTSNKLNKIEIKENCSLNTFNINLKKDEGNAGYIDIIIIKDINIINMNIYNDVYGTGLYGIKNLDLSVCDKLIQESINSIVNINNYQSGATLTIHTTPFQYITEEQKQALVDAGVTLVEYIPTETTE